MAEEIDAGLEIIGDLVVHRLDGDDLLSGSEETEALNGFFDSIAHIAKSVIHSPITRVVAGAAAFVFPPIGVPASAALLVADRAVQIADGLKHTTPAKRAEITKAVHHTIALAKMKDSHGNPEHPDALKAAEYMKLSQQLRQHQTKLIGKHGPAHVRHAAAEHGTLLRRNKRTGKLEIVKHPHGFLRA
jgi:hypothetical protein